MAALVFFVAMLVIAVCAGIAIGTALAESDERVDADEWRRQRAAMRRACAPRSIPTPTRSSRAR